MHTASLKREYGRETQFVGFQNPETGEVSFDGVHWIQNALIAVGENTDRNSSEVQPVQSGDLPRKAA